MGLKSHQMDVETPAGGKDRSKDFTRERGGFFTRGSLAGLDPGGLCPFHHDVGLGRPMTSSRSSRVLDVLEAVVCQVAHVVGS
jgi:hypothetical protein